MKVEKNTATKPARVSPKMSSTNRFHSTAAKLPDRRSFPQWQFYEIQENPSARMTILWNKRRINVDFWSKCWFGADVGDGHFYRESSCENDNSMKQETHKCRFLIKMLIWHWRWRWALLQRILERESQFYETRDAQMSIFLPNVDLALTLAMWERQRESLCENENSMTSFNQQMFFQQQSWFFIWKI